MSITRPTVLIVDDQEYIQIALGQLLEAKGYEVETALDGLTAITKVRQNRPDVVLMDLALPERNGFEVSLYLRNELGCTDMMIIGMSGYCSHLMPGVAARVGFDHYMSKPIDVEELFALLPPVTAAAPQRVGNHR